MIDTLWCPTSEKPVTKEDYSPNLMIEVRSDTIPILGFYSDYGGFFAFGDEGNKPLPNTSISRWRYAHE